MPEFKFFSIEEVKEFVGNLKGARGGKADKGEAETGTATATTGGAPVPMGIPDASQQGGFPGAGTDFPGPGAQGFPAGPSPEVQALVQRIVTKTDAALQAGQPADQALAWFRSQCGAEAANATLDQIKTVFLQKLQVPQLTQMAQLLAA